MVRIYDFYILCDYYIQLNDEYAIKNVGVVGSLRRKLTIHKFQASSNFSTQISLFCTGYLLYFM